MVIAKPPTAETSNVGAATPAQLLDAGGVQQLFDLASEYYWEQDSQFRFTHVSGLVLTRSGIDPRLALGHTRWDTGGVPIGEGVTWEAHRATLQAHQPFTDFLYRALSPSGQWRTFSVCGMPLHDCDGHFVGYAGLARDVTATQQLQQALQESKLVLETTLEYMDQGVSLIDGSFRLLCMNRRSRELLGFPADICQPGAPLEGLFRYNAQRGEYGPGAVEQQVRQRLELATRFEPHCFERTRSDGRVLEIRGTPLPNRQGFVTLYTDITERSQAEVALRASEERFRRLTALSSDWFWEQDCEYRFTRLEGRHLSGDDNAFARELGRTWWELGFEPAGGWQTPLDTLKGGEAWHDLVVRRSMPDASVRHARISGEPFLGADGRQAGYRGVGRDITLQKSAEERVEYLATHDGLTGLPNRNWFHELLDIELKAARRYGRKLAVLFVDLDSFKIINDSMGHDAGDELLRVVATRLGTCLRTSDLVARLGGDEFVVMLREVHGADQAATVARKVLTSVAEPVPIRGQACRVSASVGIGLFPGDGDDPLALMKSADIAMYQAKEGGKNAFQFFSAQLKDASLERLMVETRLREALPGGELSLAYQPRVEMGRRSIVGMEALLRWNSPHLGAVPPSRFIPVAEQSALIVPIGRWVLQQACTQAVAWDRAGLPPVRMAVNLSARQFADADLLSDIEKTLAASGLPPQRLELEITESMVMRDADHAARVLEQVKRLGIRVSIDDFGTGYSWLAQIKRFPIDALKIDRSFVRDLATNPADRAITEAIIAMGRALGLEVVAEGVETAEQLAFLQQHPCDEIQGYYFSRPLPADEAATLLAQPTLAPASAQDISRPARTDPRHR